MPRFVITVRSVSGNTFGGNLGSIRYLVVPDDVVPPAVPTTLYTTSRTDWIKQLMSTFPQDAQGAAFGNILFLVHGFNDTIADVMTQHDDIRTGLQGRLDCTIISFDWPSAGEPYAYLPDLDVAKRTAIDLVNAGIKPLVAAQTDKCRVAVHALCHSMGAYVVREALDHADDGTVTGSDWSLNQLVLIAGDIEAADFVAGNKDTESMLGHAYRLTNYFNRYDEVLQISNVKRAGTEPRVGRVGLPPNAPAKTVNIDCSTHYNALPGPKDLSQSHSWYFTDATFHADLAETLRGSMDRTVVPGRTLGLDGHTLVLP